MKINTKAVSIDDATIVEFGLYGDIDITNTATDFIKEVSEKHGIRNYVIDDYNDMRVISLNTDSDKWFNFCIEVWNYVESI